MKLAVSIVSVLLVSTWEETKGLVKKLMRVLRNNKQNVHIVASMNRASSSVRVPEDSF
jgi:hypothetical protein